MSEVFVREEKKLYDDFNEKSTSLKYFKEKLKDVKEGDLIFFDYSNVEWKPGMTHKPLMYVGKFRRVDQYSVDGLCVGLSDFLILKNPKKGNSNITIEYPYRDFNDYRESADFPAVYGKPVILTEKSEIKSKLLEKGSNQQYNEIIQHVLA